MNDNEQRRSAELRYVLRANLRNNLAEIEQLEGYLPQVSRTASLTERVEFYLRLGDAYRDLLSLLGTSTTEVMRVNTEATVHLTPPVVPRPNTRLAGNPQGHAQLRLPPAVPGPNTPLTPRGNTEATLRLTPPPTVSGTTFTQSALEIANTYYKSALDIVDLEAYPIDRKEIDRQRIEDKLKTIIRQEAIAQTVLAKQKTFSKATLSESKPRYKGYWVRPIAFRLPLVGLIFFLLLSLISFYLRIPISLAFHIPPYNCVPGSITVNGSTALLPLVNIAATKYQTLCPGSTISVNPGKLPDGTELPDGSTNGLNQVLNNSIDIATTDVFADTTLPALKEYPVAVVTLALVVNSDVTRIKTPDLSSYQIAAIYSGAVSKWSDVNAAWSSENITLVSRPSSSEIRTVFEKYVLEAPETVSGPPRLINDTSAAVANYICNTPGAIGYVPLYYYYDYYSHHNQCLHIVTIDHNEPLSKDLVKNNTYKFWSLEHMYTKEPAQGLAQAFINFMYSDTIKLYIDQYDKYGYLNPTDIASGLLGSH